MTTTTNDITKVPLRWLNDAQRKQLRSSVQDAINAMMPRWQMNPAQASSVKIDTAIDQNRSSGSCYCVTIDEAIALVMRLEFGALRWLLNLPVAAVTDTQNAESFTAAVELDFVEDFSRQLLDKVRRHSMSVKRANPADIRTRSTRLGRHILNVAVDGRICGQVEVLPSVLNQMIPRQAAKPAFGLSSRRSAVGAEQIALNATIGQVEIPFTELREVVVGDVLVLNESLAGPVKLRTLTGRRVAEAMLGRRENKIALQISSVATAESIVKRSI